MQTPAVLGSARQALPAGGHAPRLRTADVTPCSLTDGPVVPLTRGCSGAWLEGAGALPRLGGQASEFLVFSQPSWRRSCGRRWRRTSRWSRYRDERRPVRMRRCSPSAASCPSAPRPQHRQAEPRADTP